jgi:hypothetical protein
MQRSLMRIGTDIGNMEMVTTDGTGRIPAQSQELVKVFSKVMAGRMPPYRPTDHPNDLEPGYKLPYQLI